MKVNTQKAEQAEQSLNRAINGQSVQNDMIVMKEFSNRGIVATPRVDVFTYSGRFCRDIEQSNIGSVLVA